MSDRLKALREQQVEIVTQARAKLDEIKDDTAEDRAKEIESEFDRMMQTHDEIGNRIEREEKLAERKKALEDRETELEEVDDSRRPKGEDRTVPGNGGEDKGDKQEAAAYRSAFQSFLRYGASSLNAEERNLMASRRHSVRNLLGEGEARAQGVATSGAGGALVPEGFMAELIESLKAYGPMNNAEIVRRIETATGNDMPWPTADDTDNKGALIAENTQVSEQDITFGSKTLGAWKYTTKLIRVSSELLQDSAVDVEGYVRSAMAERIGRILNEDFTTGTGSSEPNGIVTASTLGVTAASSTAITADELIDLEHTVDPAYRSDPTCRFQFSDPTFKTIRKLKDGDGNYLWQPADLRAGAPSTLLGYPYSINQDILSVGTGSPTGSGSKVVIFGAMNRYVVRLVLMLAVRRLSERYADYDQVGFVGFTRADGELMDTSAIKHIATA